jgi:hypothetical protein
MFTFIVNVVTLLCFGIALWEIYLVVKKHKREIRSLKQQNAWCVSAWIYLLYSVGLLLVLVLGASSSRPRKTA